MALENVNTVMAELSHAVASVDPASVEKLKTMLASAKSVFCHGAGRSGLNARAFAMRLMHLGLHVCVVGDVLVPPISEGDLLVIATASGTSPAMVYIANKARECGAQIAVFTTSRNCPICELAQCVICFDAPTKAEDGEGRTSIMPMGTLFEESCYLLMDMIVLELMEKLNISNSDMVCRHANLE